MLLDKGMAKPSQSASLTALPKGELRWAGSTTAQIVIYHSFCPPATVEIRPRKGKHDKYLQKSIDLTGLLCYIINYLSDERLIFCAHFCAQAQF